MEHLNQSIRVAVDEDNPSIKRIEDKCIKCGMCAIACNNFVSVNDHYDLSKTNGRAICVNCGQCVKACPVDALVGKDEYKQIEELMSDKDKIFVVSTSPSVRIGLGDEFGLPAGSFVEGKMVALLRKLGFKYVLDTNFSADLTICEEASELVERLKTNAQTFPQFTSCCPAWVKFAETFYPEILKNLSTCKSPIGMQGPIIKTYFTKKMNLDPKRIVNVALTPCVAKKFEIRRKEMNISAKINKVEEMRDMDFVLTTVELSKWAKEKNIDLNKLEDDHFDNYLGTASGAGVIFGNSGGVMEAAVRTAYSYLTGKNPSELVLNLQSVRGLNGIKETKIEIAGRELKIAAVYGLANARIILDKIKNGEKYDFVEIMTCQGGCIGGAGQPKHLNEEDEYQQKRTESLYQRDKKMKYRAAHLNPEIVELYKNYLIKPNSELAIELLHTTYTDRSGDLNINRSGDLKTTKGEGKVKYIKYKCLICGTVFEVKEGEEAICPKCTVKGDLLEKIGEREAL